MSTIVGLSVRPPTNCKCGNDTAVIARSDGKYYATLTCSCGRARGSLTESTGNWIEAIVDRFGESVTIVQPAEAETMSGSVQ